MALEVCTLFESLYMFADECGTLELCAGLQMCLHGLMAHPYQRAIFDLREI